MLRLCLALGFALLLTACASPGGPPPVVEEAGQAPIERETTSSDDGSGDRESRADTSSATLALVTEARSASAAENHANAVAYLERAVRIEPRNAELWIELSAAHLNNGNLAAANQHARKAIALAGSNERLGRLAWLQLADIREAEGSSAEANAIRRRYRTGEG